jgi:hypothetical protein
VIARVLLMALLFSVAVGPWIVAAIAGLVAEPGSNDGALIVAAPSPFYVFLMMAKVDQDGSEPMMIGGFAAIAGWAAIGLGLLAAARSRSAALIAEHEAALAQTDALLAQEDEAAGQRAAEQAVPQAVPDDAEASGEPGAPTGETA